MTATQVDRRVRRTRQRLKQALLELVNQKPFEAISIREIADRADVGRSTFYSHFSTKEELLFSGFEDWLRSLTQASPPRSSLRPAGFRFSLPLLRHIREQKRFFLATIVRGSSAGMRRRTVAMIGELVRIEAARISPLRGVAAGREAYIHAAVGAFLGIVAWWLETGSKMPAEAVDEIFQRLAALPPT